MSQTRRFARGHDVYLDDWHRAPSMRRFLGARHAAQLAMIDVDSCEYCYRCYRPLALIETERWTPKPKTTTVLAYLARLADVPAYRVSYEPSSDGTDLAWFEVERLGSRPGRPRRLNPQEYADVLWSLREHHDCPQESPS